MADTGASQRKKETKKEKDDPRKPGRNVAEGTGFYGHSFRTWQDTSVPAGTWLTPLGMAAREYQAPEHLAGLRAHPLRARIKASPLQGPAVATLVARSAAPCWCGS